jgi:hypothetical protein
VSARARVPKTVKNTKLSVNTGSGAYSLTWARNGSQNSYFCSQCKHCKEGTTGSYCQLLMMALVWLLPAFSEPPTLPYSAYAREGHHSFLGH